MAESFVKTLKKAMQSWPIGLIQKQEWRNCKANRMTTILETRTVHWLLAVNHVQVKTICIKTYRRYWIKGSRTQRGIMKKLSLNDYIENSLVIVLKRRVVVNLFRSNIISYGEKSYV
jgi:hypothetical protein